MTQNAVRETTTMSISNKINTTTAIVASSNELGVFGVAAGSDTPVVGGMTQELLPSVSTITEHDESALYDWLLIKMDGFVRIQSCISLRISSGILPSNFKDCAWYISLFGS